MILAFIAAVCFGATVSIFVVSLLRAGKEEDAWWDGYRQCERDIRREMLDE